MFRVALPIDEIRRAATRAEFLTAVERLYAGLDVRIAARKPLCTNRGACCKFQSFGHRLFVTPVELAYFLATTDGPLRPPMNNDACPYQIGGLCSARLGRPSGCRIFFCDVNAQDWQPAETESTLRQIRGLHERFDLPYAYVEWLDALTQLAAPATLPLGS